MYHGAKQNRPLGGIRKKSLLPARALQGDKSQPQTEEELNRRERRARREILIQNSRFCFPGFLGALCDLGGEMPLVRSEKPDRRPHTNYSGGSCRYLHLS